MMRVGWATTDARSSIVAAEIVTARQRGISARINSSQKNGAFKKFEDLGEAGATSLDAAAFSGIANWLAVL